MKRVVGIILERGVAHMCGYEDADKTRIVHLDDERLIIKWKHTRTSGGASGMGHYVGGSTEYIVFKIISAGLGGRYSIHDFDYTLEVAEELSFPASTPGVDKDIPFHPAHKFTDLFATEEVEA